MMNGAIQRVVLGLAAAAMACASAPTRSEGPGAVPTLTVEVVVTPSPHSQGGARHLVYELAVGNPGPGPLTLTSVRLAPAGLPPVTLEGGALRDATTVRGEARPAPSVATIAPGSAALVYLWVTVPDGEAVPAQIEHTVTAERADGSSVSRALSVAVNQAPARVFRPPLDGPGWFVVNAPSHTSPHRRSVQAIDGKRHMAQRYALDFVRVLGPEGTHVGDPQDNASYHAYGEPVVAMAEGAVIAVVDGIPENLPGPTSRAVEITLATLAGNAVVVDHGEGYVATYAHLIPGRIPVAVGQRVAAGAVVGYVGNSGNSTEPHLHLHVCDAPSLLACQGRPYAFDRFVEVIVVMAPNAAPRPLPPAAREAALPLDKAWLTFGEGEPLAP